MEDDGFESLPRMVGRVTTLPHSPYLPSSSSSSQHHYYHPSSAKFSVFQPRREPLTKHLSHRDVPVSTKWHVPIAPSIQRVMSHEEGRHRLSLRDIRQNMTEEDGSEKVKDRIISLWNNVKYGWNVRLQSHFNSESAIWMLGNLYHHNLVDNCKNSQRYRHPRRQDEATVQRQKEAAVSFFKQDYFSRIWFTYRKNFPRIESTQFTTDCGWGCMIRSGQMIMAQAFIAQYLGREWRWTGSQSDKTDMIHRMIIKWFLDDNEPPFSLHRLVKIGECLGKKPGDWYGPATISHMLTQALTEAFVENPILENVVSYVAQDCTVYIQDVIKLCTQSTANRRRSSLVKKDARRRASFSINIAREFDVHRMSLPDMDFAMVDGDEEFDDEIVEDGPNTFQPRIPRSNSSIFSRRASSTLNLFADPDSQYRGSSNGNNFNPASTMTSGYASMTSTEGTVENEKWRGVIIFIPVRLGGDKFNPVYTECIKSVFSHPSTLGIIGGRPRHSLYFVGVQEEKLIYLDPHLCQEAVDDTVNFPLESFHCNCARKMSISKMDPSCTIAFLCRTRQEFYDLISSVKDFMVPGSRHTDYPIFVFSDGTSAAAKVASSMRQREVISVATRTSSSSSSLRHPHNHDSLLSAHHQEYVDNNGRRLTQSDLMSDDFVLIA